MDVKIVCRTCLRSGGRMVSIFEEKLKYLGFPQTESVVDLLKSFANIEIFQNDGYPDQICSNCLHEVERILSFKLKCEQSQEFFISLKYKELKNEMKTEKFYTVDENGIRDCFQIEYLDDFQDEENLSRYSKEESELDLKPEPDKLNVEDPVSISEAFINNHSNEQCEIYQSTSQEAPTDANLPRMKYFKRYQLKCSAFRCKFCSENFEKSDSLMEHMKTKHSMTDLPGDLTCSICSKSFKRRAHLVEHLIIHTDDRPYKCNICSITFKYKSNLNSHMRYVENKNSNCWKCPKCPRYFQRRRSYNDHLKKCAKYFHNKRKNK